MTAPEDTFWDSQRDADQEIYIGGKWISFPSKEVADAFCAGYREGSRRSRRERLMFRGSRDRRPSTPIKGDAA